MKRGFTLIELVVTIAVIGMLSALMVTNVNRSLGKNRLAEDAQLLISKIEEVRLMAGSTQQVDEVDTDKTDGTDSVRYYAIWMPVSRTIGNAGRYNAYVIKVSQDGTCDVPAAGFNESGIISQGCILETISLSKDVLTHAGVARVIGFEVPAMRPTILANTAAPGMPFDSNLEFQLYQNDRTAKISVNGITGRASVTYE